MKRTTETAIPYIPVKDEIETAIKRLNETIFLRETMVTKLLYAKKYKTDYQYDKAERLLTNLSFNTLKSRYEKILNQQTKL